MVPIVALVALWFLLLDLLVSFVGRTGPSLCLSECVCGSYGRLSWLHCGSFCWICWSPLLVVLAPVLV